MRFIHDMELQPASLLELCARTVKLHHLNYHDEVIPGSLETYLDTAHQCVNVRHMRDVFDFSLLLFSRSGPQACIHDCPPALVQVCCAQEELMKELVAMVVWSCLILSSSALHSIWCCLLSW